LRTLHEKDLDGDESHVRFTEHVCGLYDSRTLLL